MSRPEWGWSRDDENPCNGCTRRDVTETHNCHTDCPEYHKWKRVVSERKAVADADREIIDYRGCKHVAIEKKMQRRRTTYG